MKNHATNPFAVEKLREHYALKGNWKAFKKTYTASYASIKDGNTPQAWEELLHEIPGVQNPMTADRIAKTAKLVDKKGARILDIGIGNGWVEERLQKDHPGRYSFTGIDITPENLALLSKKLPGLYLKGDALHMPKEVSRSSFDYILLLEVLEHIPFVKAFDVLATIRNLLAPDGYFIISVPIYENLEEKIARGENFSHHVRRYTPNILKGELRCAGFKVVKEHQLYAFGKWYRLKTLVSKITHWRKPNVLILKCKVDTTVR